MSKRGQGGATLPRPLPDNNNKPTKKTRVMKTLRFCTRIADYETREYVYGGIALDVTEEEAEVLTSILERAHEARRTGIADRATREELQEDMTTSLANEEYVGYSYDVFMENEEGEPICGARGL